MKKILTLSIITMLLMSLLVLAAPPIPKPIRGYFTVNGVSIPGTVIEVTNTRTAEVISGDDFVQLITQSGGFAFDLSFFSQGYAGPIPGVYPGDVIEVQARGFGEAGKVSFNVPDDTPYSITIAVTLGQEILYCDDGTPVLDLASCPEEEPEPEPEPKVEIETKIISSEDKSSASVEAYLGQTIDICVTDSKIVKLLDQEIDYDGEDYDIHEESCFKGIVLTSLDDEDYGLNPYLNVLEGDITYKYIFEDLLPFEDIHIEEPLEITLLGEDYKIIYAESNEIVVRSGEEADFKEGQTRNIEGKKITVVAVMEDAVSVKVDSITKTITLDDYTEISGIEILVSQVIYQGYAEGVKLTTLLIGEDVEATYKDGDDFNDEEDFKWVISLPDYIGVVNQQDYKEIDDDEEYKAIELGGGLALPNDYLIFNFKSMSDSDVIDLTFKVDDGYLNVKGDSGSDTFVFGSEEYDEINVNVDGIYDEDEVLISSDKVRIGDSDTYLELGSVKIGLLTIKLDMSDILYDGISYLAEEGNFLDYLGIIFKGPENAVEDQSGFKVSVPEERPEITLTISSEAIVPLDDDVIDDTTDDLDDDVVIPPVFPPVEPSVTPPVEPPVTPPTIVKIICEDGTEVDSAEDCREEDTGDAIFKLAQTIFKWFGWGAGFVALAYFYYKKGDKVRAFKMLNTAIKNALAGKYKKR